MVVYIGLMYIFVEVEFLIVLGSNVFFYLLDVVSNIFNDFELWEVNRVYGSWIKVDMNYFFIVVVYEEWWFFYYIVVYVDNKIGMFYCFVYKVIVR